MRTSDFDFNLPADLIAQAPVETRDRSRLLVLNRCTRRTEHLTFKDIVRFFRPGDVLVMNDSKVIQARLRGFNEQTGGRFEILLLEKIEENDWWVMLRPGKRARVGTRIVVEDRNSQATSTVALVHSTNSEGHRRLRFQAPENILNLLPALGEVPLPPYIERPPGLHSMDQERYQTVYARDPGSVAAPTAGLHFTQETLREIQHLGVRLAFVTLHVGVGTFAPVKVEKIDAHKMHEERFSIGPEAASSIEHAKKNKCRIFATGTTTVRVLETVAAANDGEVLATTGRTNIFIHPPRNFQVVDALITNFHLPCSSLLMLVSAFASPGNLDGVALIKKTYTEAIEARYRFFSYGDAMLIL